MLKENRIRAQIGHKIGKWLSSNTNKTWYANAVSNHFRRFVIKIYYKFQNLFGHLNRMAKLAKPNP